MFVSHLDYEYQGGSNVTDTGTPGPRIVRFLGLGKIALSEFHTK